MNNKNILVTVGTRPEAIKMAPIIQALKKDERFTCKVCSTGQHKEMLQQVFDWFKIDADFHLDVMEPGQPLARLSGRILSGMQDIFNQFRPDVIMVHGDTTTAFLAALSAYYNYDFTEQHKIKVAHIEAGLRTHDMMSPYPEEGNRRLIAPLADYHFAPTVSAAHNLNAENINKDIFVVGNSVIDALLDTQSKVNALNLNPLEFLCKEKRTILVTGHRRENYGGGFEGICNALKLLAEKYEDVNIVYPVHLNPQVQKPVHELLDHISNIHLIDPLDYPSFISAMHQSHIILTDSGGIQEEAPSLGKPVLVMRDTTERPEAVEAGTVKVVGTDERKILDEVSKLLDNDEAYKKMSESINPYGDGHTTKRILNILAGENPLENVFHYPGNAAIFKQNKEN